MGGVNSGQNSKVAIVPGSAPVSRYPYEERIIFGLVISDLKARSGGKGKIMSYIFKEYFDIPFVWSDRFLQTLGRMREGFVDGSIVGNKLTDFILGDFDSQVYLLFKAFDYNRSGAIELEELAQMLAHMPKELVIVKKHNASTELYKIVSIREKPASDETVVERNDFHRELIGIAGKIMQSSSRGNSLTYKEFVRFIGQNGAVLDFLVERFRRPVTVPVFEQNTQRIEDKKEELKKRQNVKCGCCYYESPARWEAFNALLFQDCTKQGELLLEDNKNKGRSEHVKLCQRQDYLYLVSLDYTKIIEVIGLHNVLAMQRSGKTHEDRGLELLYDSSEATISRKFYSSNEEVVQGWIASLNGYNGMGKLFEKYKMGEEFAKGKFAIVYGCVEVGNTRELAVKAIDKVRLNQKERRFLNNEMAITKELLHKNIARCYEVIETKTYTYIVMDRVPGGELFAMLQERRSFSEFESCYIVYHLLCALQYLHSCGIMHRDLKPENILLVLNQNDDHVITIKLIDFGIACMLRPDEFIDDTCGTLSYVAPEVLKKEGYNAKADMWSVGVITYRLLRGKTPFNEENDKELPDKIMSGEICYDDAWKGLSEDSRDFVKHLLTRNTKERMSAGQALEHPWMVKNKSRIASTKLKYYKENPKLRGEIALEDCGGVEQREVRVATSRKSMDESPAVKKATNKM